MDVEGKEPELTKKVIQEQVAKLFGGMEKGEGRASV